MRIGDLFSGGIYRWLLALGLMLGASSAADAATHWVSASFGQIPPGAIVGGRESTGQKLYICRATYNGGVHPGKIRVEFRGCNIGYGGREVTVNQYQVLIDAGR